MKHVLLLWLIISVYVGKAQNNWEAKSDSLALVSRNKADMVLSHIDTANTNMLYSLSNQYYYVIAKSTNTYKEYYIYTDTLGNILQFQEIEKQSTRKQAKKRLKQIELDTVSLNKAFDVDRYNADFITITNNQNTPDAKYDWSVPSYFVIKDKNGKRYGECYISAFDTPLLIDSNIHAYLLIGILIEQ